GARGGSERRMGVDWGGPGVQQVSTLRVRLRAQKPGKLVLPPAELHTSSGVFRSQPLTLMVKAGHVADPGGGRTHPDPFGMSPFGEDEDNPFDAFRRRTQTAGERELFLRGD